MVDSANKAMRACIDSVTKEMDSEEWTSGGSTGRPAGQAVEMRAEMRRNAGAAT
jgi:hypothetical protein